MNILTTEDARFIDREVPKQLGISLEILMENAGRGIVDALWGEYDLFSLNNGRSINSFVLFIFSIGVLLYITFSLVEINVSMTFIMVLLPELLDPVIAVIFLSSIFRLKS